MGRPTRNERLAAKGRPKRRAAKTHFFKYQLSSNPTRAEENDLKRALEESLYEQNGSAHSIKVKTTPTSTPSSNNKSKQQIPKQPKSTSNGKNTSSSSNSSSGRTSLNKSRDSIVSKNSIVSSNANSSYEYQSHDHLPATPQHKTPPAKPSPKQNQNNHATPPTPTTPPATKQRNPQGSWSLIGPPEEKLIYLRDDEPPRRLICYPAIKHVEGDVIQVKDSVLLRSGAKKTDPPYIAKVCSFWNNAETGNVMMSLYWYYRPEHTEEGRKPHHLCDEIFASRHRDVDSVECIEDKCYVLTFNEYCRYRKRCKMEQVNTTWSLTDVTIPLLNECYSRRNRIPDSDVSPELVFCCRQIYDSRFKRLVKNPLINPKYGHI